MFTAPPRRASSMILALDHRQVRFIDSVHLKAAGYQGTFQLNHE